jgi:hypothetical protein
MNPTMHTSHPGIDVEPRRSSWRFSRAALLPVLVGVLVPKCPVCIAIYLSAAGTGASIARGAAPLVVHAGNALVAAALVGLGVRVVKSRRRGLLALFALSAGALLVLALAFPTLLWPRLAALWVVGVSVLRAGRVARQATAPA